MTYRVEGPFPLTVRPTENGADLDVTQFLVRAVLLQLFANAAEDPEGIGEELADMHALSVTAQRQGHDSRARREFDECLDEMMGGFGEGRISLYTSGLRQLRDACDAVLKSRENPTAATATPGLTARQQRLLDAIRSHGGEWTTSRVLHLFALTDPSVVQRGTARRDLDTLHRAGHLVLVDDPDNRHYTLHT